MRVLLLVTSMARGGAEAVVLQLAREMARRGHDVQVVSLLGPAATPEALGYPEVAYSHLGLNPKLPSPAAMVRYVRLLRRFQPDVVHAHCVHANLLARFAQILRKSPRLICTAHSIREENRKGSKLSLRLRDLEYRLSDRFCDLTTNVCNAGVARYVAVRASKPDRIVYVPNFIDTTAYRRDESVAARVRADLGWGDRFVWLHVGRLTPVKNQAGLLQAFAGVVREHPNSLLAIAGDGELRGELEEQACSLLPAGAVQFLGFRGDVQDLMSAADGFVLNSDFEGFPMVLLEACSLELPVVSTNTGGCEDIIGETGRLVPPRDVEALTAAMLAVTAMTLGERRQVGLKARQRIVEQFDMARGIDRWLEIYAAGRDGFNARS